MSRFFLSDGAKADLAEIRQYLNTLPAFVDRKAASSLLKTLNSIAEALHLGAGHSSLTRLLGTEVRSRLSHPYRVYYRLGRAAPEVIAILHTAWDDRSILKERFQ